MLCIPHKLLLKHLRLPRLEVFLHGLSRVRLNLHDLLAEVLPEQGQLLPQLLNCLFVDHGLLLADLLNIRILIFCLLLHFVDLFVQCIVIADEALAVLLLNHRDEVILPVGPLESLPDARRVALFLGTAQKDFNQAQIRDSIGIRSEIVQQFDLIVELIDRLEV